MSRDIIALASIVEVSSFKPHSVFQGILYCKKDSAFHKYENFSDVIAGNVKFWSFCSGDQNFE